MTRIIEIDNTNIRIEVSNAREMYRIFSRLHKYETLIIRDIKSRVHDLYPCGADEWYTEKYFDVMYFS